MFKTILGNKDKATTRQIIEKYLTARNFRFETTENENNLVVPVSGENGNWKVLICVDEKRGILELYSHCPVSIKETQKLKIAELISRINNLLLIGYFSISLEECEIVFKTVHLFADTEITIKNLEILFSTNTQTLDEYLPAITAVNSGYSEPCLAIQ
jgi:hypothetical protein